MSAVNVLSRPILRRLAPEHADDTARPRIRVLVSRSLAFAREIRTASESMSAAVLSATLTASQLQN
jgi:hypothetical protein